MSVSNESPIQVNYRRPRSSGFHASALQLVALICNQALQASLKSWNALGFSWKTFPQLFVQTSCPTCVTRLKLAPTKKTKQMLTQKLNLQGKSGVASLTPGFGTWSEDPVPILENRMTRRHPGGRGGQKAPENLKSNSTLIPEELWKPPQLFHGLTLEKVGFKSRL